jgi:hypothetical protein
MLSGRDRGLNAGCAVRSYLGIEIDFGIWVS